MLTNLQSAFTGGLRNKFATSWYERSHYISNVLLLYLVKLSCLKNTNWST